MLFCVQEMNGPVCPGSDEYVLGSPLFKNATIHLENGKKVVLQAPKNSDENRYISEMKVNGKKYTKNYLKHDQLLNGVKIQYTMNDQPVYNRGVNVYDFPYSLSNE